MKTLRITIAFCRASGLGGHVIQLQGPGGPGHIFIASAFTGISSGGFSCNVQEQSGFDDEMISSIITESEPASQLRLRFTVRSAWLNVAVTTRVSPFLSMVPFLGNDTSNVDLVFSDGNVADSMHPACSPHGHTR